MSEELIGVFDKSGDFLFTATSEAQAEQLWRSAVERGLRPCLLDEVEEGGVFDDEQPE